MPATTSPVHAIGTPSRRVLLGSFWGMPAVVALPFLQSLRGTGYDGRLVLFTHSITDEDRSVLLNWADELVDVDVPFSAGQRPVARGLRAFKAIPKVRRMYPLVFRLIIRCVRPRHRRSWSRSLEFATSGIQSLRYEFYLAYLRNHADEFDEVLISDVRDVVFQADPFDPPLTRLEVFLERDDKRLGAPGFNRKVGRSIYGSDWRGLRDHVPSCSGVTAGPIDEMVEYLGQMANAIRNIHLALGPRDQAVHNWLLRTGHLPQAQYVANGVGRVLTVDAVQSLTVSNGGLRRASDGQLIPIVHQYDRVPALVEHVRATLAR